MAGHEIMQLIAFRNKETEYAVLHKFREALCAGLQREGVHISTIDLNLSDLQSFLKTIYSSPPDYTFAFNGIRKLSNGQSLAEQIDVPHISWQVDAAHFGREYTEMPLQLIITPDQTSADIFKKWGSQAFFLPHGGELFPIVQEKKYPISFPCSIEDPEIAEANFSPELIEAADRVLKTPSLCYQDALKGIIDLDDPEKDELVQEFDLYLRAKERVTLIRGLRGLPLHLFGNVRGESSRSFQEIIGGDCSSFTFHSGLDVDQMIEAMQRSSILLNSSPMFKTGAHERIFYGQGAGALVLTNDTPWIQQNYKPDQDILTYQVAHLPSTVEAIKHLLNHPKELSAMASQGRERMAKEHTWELRAKQLLSIVQTELPKFYE
jgi:spore maturation protein CgeB